MAQRRRTRSAWGKVRKLPSGRYQASYVGPDSARHAAPMTYSAKIDADAWLATQRALIVSGSWRPSTPAAAHVAQAERAQTLGTYAAAWLTTRTNARGDHLRPRTASEYERLLSGPLSPLTPLPVASLTPATVRAWRAATLATGRKTQTSRAYGLLNAIMRTAVEDGLSKSNPCTVKGGQSTYTGRDVSPPTDAELDTITATITPRFRAFVLVAAWGGLRYGELTELRRRDVSTVTDEHGELSGIRIRVERAVTRSAGGEFIVGEPKSRAGVRTVALPHHVLADVHAHLSEHVGRFGDSLLFPAADGASHLATGTFAKHWYTARAAAGRSDMPFHALRHYAGTVYAQTGATVRETMARLGHSSTAAAMRYQHATGRDDELAARMSRRRAD